MMSAYFWAENRKRLNVNYSSRFQRILIMHRVLFSAADCPLVNPLSFLYSHSFALGYMLKLTSQKLPKAKVNTPYQWVEW